VHSNWPQDGSCATSMSSLSIVQKVGALC
jgi:hypothetical protein